MLSHDLDDAQWGQCLLKSRLGEIGVNGNCVYGLVYVYDSILACLPAIAKVDLAQSLGLKPVLFNRGGSPHPTNQYGCLPSALHVDVSDTYDRAMEIDRDLSLHVLDSLPEEPTPTPEAITPFDREGLYTLSTLTHALTQRPHAQGKEAPVILL